MRQLYVISIKFTRESASEQSVHMAGSYGDQLALTEKQEKYDSARSDKKQNKMALLSSVGVITGGKRDVDRFHVGGT